jgi:hypothetical protein
MSTSPFDDSQPSPANAVLSSCDTIQQAAGINSTLLHTNNPQIDEACQNIYIGQVLCTAKSVQVPPVPSGGIPTSAIASSVAPASVDTSASVAPASVATSSLDAVTSSAVATSTHAATRSTVLVTQTVTSDYAAATSSDEDVDQSGDPNDDSLPWCDEL